MAGAISKPELTDWRSQENREIALRYATEFRGARGHLVISHVSGDQIRSALDPVADAFATQEQTDPNTNEQGWGQFLNVSRRHIQIGSYGTAFALLALGLSNRISSFSAQNIACLTEKWGARTALPSRSSQTLRLAFVHLVLRIVRQRNGGTLQPALEHIYNDTHAELVNRCINQNAGVTGGLIMIGMIELQVSSRPA